MRLASSAFRTASEYIGIKKTCHNYRHCTNSVPLGIVCINIHTIFGVDEKSFFSFFIPRIDFLFYFSYPTRDLKTSAYHIFPFNFKDVCGNMLSVVLSFFRI